MGLANNNRPETPVSHADDTDDEAIQLNTSFLRNFAPEAGESVEAGIRFTF